ncbi:MAG TPA: diacylglycerol kinase family protein [Burkholderiales bacterium]
MPSQAVATIRYAMRGVGFLLEARNARVLLGMTIAALAVAAYLGVSVLEWCALILALTGVWVAEALNSALERLTDLASPQFHPLAGKAKDLAAGAVLLASIGAISTAVVIFGARLI